MSHARSSSATRSTQVDRLIDELPSTVKSLNDGWLSTCQTAATAVCH